MDLGIGGDLISNGDVHFLIQFLATSVPSPVDFSLEFGTGPPGPIVVGADGSALPFSNATYALTIVPEPSTALLVGLGLFGLAANRRT
jgi:hypothetical protein